MPVSLPPASAAGTLTPAVAAIVPGGEPFRVYNPGGMSILTRGFAMLLLIAATACGSDKPLKVTNIQLGRSLNADTSVGNFTTTFAPNDTVHVAVLTEGSGDATISVRWTFAGQVLGEPKKQVSFKDVAVTEFHLENATGFPPGDYSVEVFLNGQSVGVRPFKVGKR